MSTRSPNAKGKAPALFLDPQPPGSPIRSKSPTMPPASPPSPRRPAATRAHTLVSTNSLSVPSTPFYTPQVSSVNVGNTATKRLLVPTVRAPRPPPTSPRVPSSRPSPSKLGRSRAGSLSLVAEVSERTVTGASEWIQGGEKFEVTEEQLELEGFQIYAVEKWYVTITSYDVFTP